jgi:hypothetical protein
MNSIHACMCVLHLLTIRSMSTSSICCAATAKETPVAKGYPFTSDTLILPVPINPQLKVLFKGKNCMEHLHKTVLSQKAHQMIEVDIPTKYGLAQY